MHFTVANLDHHIASMDSNVGDEFKGAQTSAEQSSLYFVLQTGIGNPQTNGLDATSFQNEENTRDSDMSLYPLSQIATRSSGTPCWDAVRRLPHEASGAAVTVRTNLRRGSETLSLRQQTITTSTIGIAIGSPGGSYRRGLCSGQAKQVYTDGCE